MNGPRNGRRISSLSVTYQEEFHKSTSAGLPEAPVANKLTPASACVPRDQTLEDICEEFQDLSDIQELNAPSSFYSSQEGCPIPALLPAAAPAVVYNWPAGNPLYGLEDSLRQEINVQIESFRASVQQTICQQFDLHRHSTAVGSMPCKLPSDVRMNYCQEPHVVPSAELQQRSDYYKNTCQSETEEPQQDQPETDAAYHNLSNYSPEDSLYTAAERSNSSTCTVDSGIEEVDTHSLDQQMDQCLIQLQMYASLISHTLTRTEYST